MRARIRQPRNNFSIEVIGQDQKFYIITKEKDWVVLYGIETLKGNAWHEKKLTGIAIHKNIGHAVHILAKKNNIYLPKTVIDYFEKIVLAFKPRRKKSFWNFLKFTRR